jgi:molybdopterin-guanine dinucleotide biosynthesis protein B
MAYIFAVSGMKNSGKTKLCLLLLKYLKEAGIHVGYIKHSHEKELNSQGKYVI